VKVECHRFDNQSEEEPREVVDTLSLLGEHILSAQRVSVYGWVLTEDREDSGYRSTSDGDYSPDLRQLREEGHGRAGALAVINEVDISNQALVLPIGGVSRQLANAVERGV